MDSSSGKSARSRFAICSGLHDAAQRRSARRPCRRPIQRTSGPGTATPPGLVIVPASRSCTYSRRTWFAASFATFGRRARRSACHCAAMARYSSPPPRVAALRRSSREIVDGDRPTRLAISRTPHPRTRKIAISSRSANDRYRPDSGARLTGRIPPLSRNQRVPTAGDTPASMPASSLAIPLAIAPRTAAGVLAWPPEAAPANASPAAPPAQPPTPAVAPFAHLHLKVLRRPVESAHVNSVLAGGGCVTADGVAVPGRGLGAEPAADLLLGFRGAQVAFCQVAGGRDGGVGEEPQHVGFAVLEAFPQVQGGRLLDVAAAGDAADLGQAGVDAVAEEFQVPGGQLVRDGGQPLVAGDVGGVDEGPQLPGDLAGPDRVRVGLRGVLDVSQQVGGAQLVADVGEVIVVDVPVVDDDGPMQVAVDEALERGQRPLAEEVIVIGEQAGAGGLQVLLVRLGAR